MNGEGAGRARLLGALLMAGAALPALLFLVGASRRSYLALALPVGAGLGLVSALAFWVGYTMAFARDDEDDDAPPPPFPPSDPEGEAPPAGA